MRKIPFHNMIQNNYDLGFCQKGKYIKILKPKIQIITFISLILPPCIGNIIMLYIFSSRLVISIVQVLMYVLLVISLGIFMISCLVEPGIIPGYQVYSDLMYYLKQTFTQRQNDQNFDDQPLAIVISYTPMAIPIVIVHRTGHKLLINYCTKCKMYKTPMAGHSKEMNRCILRMDHFCPYIGQYQGLYNSRMYYIMLSTLQFYLFICLAYYIALSILLILIISKTLVQYKDSLIGRLLTNTGHKTVQIVFLIISLGVIGTLISYIHSISDLIYRHKKHLIYHTPTRYINDKQIQAQYGYDYTLFSKKDNMKDLNLASKNKYKPFSNTALFVTYIKKLVKKNKNIKNFNDLLNVMRADKATYTPELQWLLEFTYLCSLVQNDTMPQTYLPRFLEDQTLLPIFNSFLMSVVYANYNSNINIPRAQLKEGILQVLISNLLTYMEQMIPYYAYKADAVDRKAINQAFENGIPILNCSTLITSLAACRIGLMHAFRGRNDDISYEQYISTIGLSLYNKEQMRLKFNVCGIESECKKKQNMEEETDNNTMDITIQEPEQQIIASPVKDQVAKQNHGKYVSVMQSPPYM